MTFFNQYMVLTYLARGNFGKVYLCLNTADHRLYAVKVGELTLVVTIEFPLMPTLTNTPPCAKRLQAELLTEVTASMIHGCARSQCAKPCRPLHRRRPRSPARSRRPSRRPTRPRCCARR